MEGLDFLVPSMGSRALLGQLGIFCAMLVLPRVVKDQRPL